MLHVKNFSCLQAFQARLFSRKKDSSVRMGLFISAICAIFSSAAFSGTGISLLWEKGIVRKDVNIISPYTIKVDEDKEVVRVAGVSYIYDRQKKPRKNSPELFEYRLDLKDNTSETRTLMKMDEEDITVYHGSTHVEDSRIIGDKLLIVKSVYRSSDFQELAIGIDWEVKTGKIPGLTRKSASTIGGCRNMQGEVFLCGNSGYIRKVNSDGTVGWDTNYESDKSDTTLDVAFSESEKMLFAFGCSFVSDTKFTTKDSSLWLAKLDSNGNFKAKRGFEGHFNLGRRALFCLSESDCPTAIYDNGGKKNLEIFVSKFSKDLKSKAWTTLLFEGKKMLIMPISLLPLENDYTLAILYIIGRSSNSFNFYVLDDKGVLVNKGIFNINLNSPNCVTTVYKDQIFIATVGNNLVEENKNPFAKLLCFKIEDFYR